MDKNYLTYNHRNYGYDHQLYDWQIERSRKIQWPHKKKLVFCLNICVQHYPILQKGQPFPPPYGMKMPTPDLRHFTLRDYGNRVGIYRILDILDKYNVIPSFAINAELALIYPELVKILCKKGEIIAHGWNMDSHHFGGLNIKEEKKLIKNSIEILEKFSNKPISGWFSPSKNQSENTLSILSECGIKYCCDWVNDELPYKFNTSPNRIISFPFSTEIEDTFVMMNNLHSEDSWKDQVLDSFNFLLDESTYDGGKILTLNIHPWLVGQPHRIGILEDIIRNIMLHKDIWQVTPDTLLDYYDKEGGL